MDPITAAIGIAGLGVQLFGSQMESSYTSQESALSLQNTRLQMQENQQRQLAMQISARRQQTEIMRSSQLRMSQNLAAGVSQTGGTEGSSVQAGQQGAEAGGAYNLLGVGQNLAIGNKLFGIQNQISQNQIAMSGLQSQASTWASVSAIGGSLAGSAGPLGNILGNFFGNQSDPTASKTQGGMGLYGGAQTGNLY